MDTNAKIRHAGTGIVITVLCILLFEGLFAVNHGFAHFYFHRYYVWISILLRQVLGKVPFSVGDVIYAALVITSIIYLLKLCYKLIRGQWKVLGYQLLRGVQCLLGLYLAFLLLWGYNYRRHSLAADMQLKVAPYGEEQLYRLADTLLQQMNSCKAALGDTMAATHPGADSAAMFSQAISAYQLAAERWPALQYRPPSLKPSLYGKLLNYMNVGGYLNPLTGEAQVNTTTPGFLHPFTICHEIAHQVGYAPEETANFIGYLVAVNSPDMRFRYAANFEMFMYSVRQMGRRDTALASGLLRRVVPGVKADYQQLRNFYEQYQSPLDDYTSLIYDQYLKANKQEKGIHSYTEVVAWLIAYYRL